MKIGTSKSPRGSGSLAENENRLLWVGLGWVSKYLRVLHSADRKMEGEDGQAVSSISSNVCDVVERRGNELGKALN